MDDSLFKKMNLKAGMTICVIAPADTFAKFLDQQEMIDVVTQDADFVVAFVRERAELRQRIDEAKQARKPGANYGSPIPRRHRLINPTSTAIRCFN